MTPGIQKAIDILNDLILSLFLAGDIDGVATIERVRDRLIKEYHENT